MERLTTEIDGRALDVVVSGPDDGLPLVFHVGTPMSKVQFAPFADAAAARGLRMVTYSRPGYGTSTRQPGRSVADAARDTEAILDALDAERCLQLGWSGGGPHALACAALLPDRVSGCATIAGVGPFGADGLDFLAGMGEANVEEFSYIAAGDDDGAIHFMRAYEEEMRDATPRDVVESLRSLLPPVDVETIGAELGSFFVENDREAFRNGIWGWFDDDLAFLKDWGFSLDAIETPVAIWQGRQDKMVPFAHGEWLAGHTAGARSHLLDDHGHLSIAVSSFDRVLDDLLEMEKERG
jgi:pimeloyl-ACP methyl ester carboxylesterase